MKTDLWAKFKQLEINVGESLREICPECGGGQTKEKSLSITLNEQGYLLWNCHRASCGFSGARLAWGAVRGVGLVPKKPPRGFIGALEALSDAQVRLLETTFGLKVPQSWRYAPESGRIYMPVLGPTWNHRGAILRTLPSDPRAPKSLTFKEATEEPWQHWTNGGDFRPVIVEDMTSAAKVQQCGIPAVCILGTHLSIDKVRELINHTDTAILALDKDAYAKAVRYAVEYKHLLHLSVWHLEQDLKYVPEERIIEAYHNGKCDFSAQNTTR